MTSDGSVDPPFDSIAETVNDQTAAALGLLGNETRLEILVALWDAIERTPPIAAEDESGLSFSELYDHVAVTDSGQFNYHLDKLTGKFVDNADGTYELTASANRILSAIIAGAVTDAPSFADEPIDTDCLNCGGSVVIDYDDGMLHVRCTDCDGWFRAPNQPPGLLTTAKRSPAGLTNRTPQEFFRQGNISQRHSVLSFFEGVCPDCMGTVTVTAHICENHAVDDSPCPHCGHRNKMSWTYVCDMCKSRHSTGPSAPIFTETAVLSFCYERGLDVYTSWDTSSGDVLDAVETTVSSRDPLELTVTVELDGDRMIVTLDEDANVVDIEETTS